MPVAALPVPTSPPQTPITRSHPRSPAAHHLTRPSPRTPSPRTRSPRTRSTRTPGTRRIQVGVLGQLNADWQAARDAPAPPQWHTHHALTTARQVGDVERLHGDAPDAALAALLKLAGAGDAVAGRAALQLMLGEATRIAARTMHHTDGSREDHRGRVIAAMWTAIRSYPVDRPAEGVRARLALDTLRAVTPQKGITEVPVVDVAPEVMERAADRVVGAADEAEARAGDEAVLALLAWGVERGHVTAEDARVVYLYHSPAESTRRFRADLAADLATSPGALRQRVSRATRRLTAATRAALGAGDHLLTDLAMDLAS